MLLEFVRTFSQFPSHKYHIYTSTDSPKSPAEDGSPGLVLYHGGGFSLGGLDNETSLCRKWTELGGIAVNVDYRLAPEHKFPVAVEDAYDALAWVRQDFYSST